MSADPVIRELEIRASQHDYELFDDQMPLEADSSKTKSPIRNHSTPERIAAEQIAALESAIRAEKLPEESHATIVEAARKELLAGGRSGFRARVDDYLDLVAVIGEFDRSYTFSDTSIAELIAVLVKSEDFPFQLNELLTRIMFDDALKPFRKGINARLRRGIDG